MASRLPIADAGIPYAGFVVNSPPESRLGIHFQGAALASRIARVDVKVTEQPLLLEQRGTGLPTV